MVECNLVMKRVVSIVTAVGFLVGCGATSSSASTCALGPEFESSVVASTETFDDFSRTSPRQLQSSMSVLLLSVSRMLEVAPPDIVEELEVIERSYSEVSVALQAVAWDTSIADSDPLVAQALQVLTRDEVIESMATLRDFFTTECDSELKALPRLDDGAATTLPTPLANTDPDEYIESTLDFDGEESALRSYGTYVADQYGEAVTDEQASCIGLALVTRSESNVPETPSQYESFVIDTIARCVG